MISTLGNKEIMLIQLQRTLFQFQIQKSDEDSNIIPKLRKHTPRRSNRLAGNKPRYSGLFFCEEGEYSTSAVSKLFQRDERFLSSNNLGNKTTHSSPAT